MTLKEWYTVEVWPYNGGTAPIKVPLSDFDEYLNTTENSRLDDLEETINTETTGLVDRVAALEVVSQKAIDGGVTAAVASTGTLTLSGNVSPNDSVKIGGKTYVFVENPSSENEIDIGVNASTTLDNLVAAINEDAGEGTAYGTGTKANGLVTAGAEDGDVISFTAIIKGEAGDLVEIRKAEDALDVMTFSATTLKNGVNGTVGEAGDIRFESDKIWVAIDDCTVSDSSNWKYISFTG